MIPRAEVYRAFSAPFTVVSDARAFRSLSPVVQALVATTGAYLLTAIGTLPVFCFRSASRQVSMDGGLIPGLRENLRAVA